MLTSIGRYQATRRTAVVRGVRNRPDVRSVVFDREKRERSAGPAEVVRYVTTANGFRGNAPPLPSVWFGAARAFCGKANQLGATPGRSPSAFTRDNTKEPSCFLVLVDLPSAPSPALSISFTFKHVRIGEFPRGLLIPPPADPSFDR